jgi:hypothetical protein
LSSRSNWRKQKDEELSLSANTAHTHTETVWSQYSQNSVTH